MILSDFYSAIDTDQFGFTRAQGSRFAKDIAGDFNPLHDEQAKKFCVPGDLLFSLTLAKLGVSKQMQFTFNGMVTEGINLSFKDSDTDNLSVVDANQKQYLEIERSGETSHNETFANALAQSYVAFSGHTFPHVLVPLMQAQNAMINPARPMVIYQSMAIDLDKLDFASVALEVTHTELNVEGKRGKALLQFCFKDGDEIVGKGEKVMILSGLRDYDQAIIDDLVNNYAASKQAYVNG